MLMEWTFQSKDIQWLNVQKTKKKTHLQATYKVFASELKTHKDWKWNEIKKSGVGILISDKIDIKTKMTKDKGIT